MTKTEFSGQGKNSDHNSSKKNELINFTRCAVQYIIEQETVELLRKRAPIGVT